MELQQAIDTLQDNSEFKEWKEQNTDSYFSHAFIMLQGDSKEWQLGYYDKASDKITTFVVEGENVSLRPEEEVFKKEHHEVKAIDLDNAKLTFSQVLERTKEFQSKEYAKDLPMKIIGILQDIEPHGNVWNMTYVTQAFNTLNIKIHPSTGEVLDHKLTSIFDFKQE